MVKSSQGPETSELAILLDMECHVYEDMLKQRFLQ